MYQEIVHALAYAAGRTLLLAAQQLTSALHGGGTSPLSARAFALAVSAACQAALDGTVVHSQQHKPSRLWARHQSACMDKRNNCCCDIMAKDAYQLHGMSRNAPVLALVGSDGEFVYTVANGPMLEGFPVVGNHLALIPVAACRLTLHMSIIVSQFVQYGWYANQGGSHSQERGIREGLTLRRGGSLAVIGLMCGGRAPWRAGDVCPSGTRVVRYIVQLLLQAALHLRDVNVHLHSSSRVSGISTVCKVGKHHRSRALPAPGCGGRCC